LGVRWDSPTSAPGLGYCIGFNATGAFLQAQNSVMMLADVIEKVGRVAMRRYALQHAATQRNMLQHSLVAGSTEGR
jgi:uncharacterized membrane protein YeiB